MGSRAGWIPVCFLMKGLSSCTTANGERHVPQVPNLAEITYANEAYAMNKE